MATEYTLTYFDIRGWAEPARFILSYAGAKWKDNRVPWVPDVATVPAELKARLPYGQLPVLEFDGKIIAQSAAISRYLARQYKLTGKDDFEAAKADEIVDSCKDIANLFRPVFIEKDPVKKAEGFKGAAQQAKEKYLTRFNEYIQANKGGYLVGDDLTWADIMVSCFIEMFQGICQVELAEGLPDLEGLVKKVFELPGIKEWVASRPVTIM